MQNHESAFKPSGSHMADPQHVFAATTERAARDLL